MTAVHPTSALPESVNEDTVRRLCGAAVYDEADKLQRDGHVLSPRLGEHGPEASVRGTWRRVDHVTVRVRAGRLLPTCARDGNGFCRHVGALLLQCLRQPRSLAPDHRTDDGTAEMTSDRQGAGAPNDTDEAPAAELGRLLENDTAMHLRQIARRRGVRLSGNKKAGIVQQLTLALMEPASIDTAIAELDHADRIALDATHLLSAETPVPSEKVRGGMRALGCSDDYSLDSLLETGLVTLAIRHAYNGEAYTVPRVVAARLPALGDLAHQVDVASTDSQTGESLPLSIIETIQVIAQTSLADRIGTRQRSRQHNSLGYAPPGFIFDPSESGDVRTLPQARADGVRLVPPRLLADADLARLSDRTGQSVGSVDSVVRIMLALQVARTTPEVAIRFDRLQAMLDMPQSVRLATLSRAWLLEAGPSTSDLLFGPGGAIELRWQQRFSTWIPSLQPALASAAQLVARLVSRMPEDTPYDLASFVDSVERLSPLATPALAQLRTTLTNPRALTMTSRTSQGKQEPLDLTAPEGWNRFLTALVTALLAGPLTWLGFVKVSTQPGRPRTFRIRTEAGVLTDRPVTADASQQHATLTFGDDLTVLVPPDATDVDVHGLLSRAGDLIDASMTGLRYRLTPAGIQAVFDSGMTGPEITQLLAETAGGTLPEAVRKTLDSWWQDFGAVRLYDELTVIELSDDLVLPELLASTGIESAIVQRFSSRLIAIDAARAQNVIDELSDRGFTPRIIEES